MRVDLAGEAGASSSTVSNIYSLSLFVGESSNLRVQVAKAGDMETHQLQTSVEYSVPSSSEAAGGTSYTIPNPLSLSVSPPSSRVAFGPLD